MLSQIPTHLVAGPLGAGKTSLIKHLLEQARPADERWAILVNEFGLVGIDAALLEGGDGDVTISEIPGGCLCCVNGVPFQVGLGRLLRRAKPHRLFIEASGLGHPPELLSQLSRAPWAGVLELQPLIMVLDAQSLLEGRELPNAQASALGLAGLILMNKAGTLGESEREVLAQRLLQQNRLIWRDARDLSWGDIPQTEVSANQEPVALSLPDAPPTLGTLWRSKDAMVCQESERDGWHSLGWRAHPELLFDPRELELWLEIGDWRRAKGVIHTTKGWMHFNALDGGAIEWQPSAWSKDNRLELLYDQQPDRATLESGLRTAIARD